MTHYPLPLTSKAVTFGILVGMLPMLGALGWGATLSHADVERGYWVIAVFAGLAVGFWGGQKLARALFGETAIVDEDTRTVRIGKRVIPFSAITSVELTFDQRYVRRAGQMLFAQVVVAAGVERFVFLNRTVDPSLRKQTDEALRPLAKKLARTLGRQLN